MDFSMRASQNLLKKDAQIFLTTNSLNKRKALRNAPCSMLMLHLPKNCSLLSCSAPKIAAQGAKLCMDTVCSVGPVRIRPLSRHRSTRDSLNLEESKITDPNTAVYST